MKKLYILFFLVFFLISEYLLAYRSNPNDFIIELTDNAFVAEYNTVDNKIPSFKFYIN